MGLYLIDSARTGAANMAADQFMLERSAAEEVPLLRFYRWERPTLSLGYFQRFDDRRLHPPSLNIDVVRRATGGGAIVHHFDWTYAIALPSSLVRPQEKSNTGGARRMEIGPSQLLYDSVHQAVVTWLQQRGFSHAQMWHAGCEARSSTEAGCSFLCFERRSLGDIVIGNSKVMGSAQRRHAGALLQHGSLLLRRSEHAPSLVGLEELATCDSTADNWPANGEHVLNVELDFCDRIIAAIKEQFCLTFQSVRSLSELLPNADFEAETQFSSTNWTRRT